MICRCCGRRTLPAPAGPSTRVVRFYMWSPLVGWKHAPSEGVPHAMLQAEILCWRCHAWSDTTSPVFGKLYNVR